MRCNVRLEGTEWIIRPTSGLFAGLDVARAEGITLENVCFLKDSMTGEITASWGLTLTDDEIACSLDSLKALGIGQVFRNRAPIQLLSDGGDGYMCGESGTRITRAAHVMLLQKGMYYGSI